MVRLVFGGGGDGIGIRSPFDFGMFLVGGMGDRKKKEEFSVEIYLSFRGKGK